MGDCSCKTLYAAAKKEAEQAGRSESVIDALIRLGNAHFSFLNYVSEIVDEVEFSVPPDETKQSHNEALRELAEAAPEVNEGL